MVSLDVSAHLCYSIPIAYDIVIRKKKLVYFIKWAAISAVICLLLLVAIDSYYYGKIVIAPLNIVLYNVFSDHGPNIYGQCFSSSCVFVHFCVCTHYLPVHSNVFVYSYLLHQVLSLGVSTS